MSTDLQSFIERMILQMLSHYEIVLKRSLT